MRTRFWTTGAIVLACALAAGSSAAQTSTLPAPWTVAVTPTMNPLPAGFCAAVRLDITDAGSRDVPRNPAGYRVTMADFDMAVSAPDGKSVAGQQIDASHWSVCACQGAPVGTVATITATYPAQSLTARARVAGVALQSTATFSTTRAKGETNPPACQSAGAPQMARTEPAAAPLASIPTRPRVAPVQTGFRLLPSVPIIATLGWDSMPNAVSYTLRRAGGGAPSSERRTVSQAAPKTVRDTIADPRIVYRYTLVVNYADGTSAESQPVDFTSPALKNPSDFTAKDRGLGNVDFAWQPVGGAVRYRLDGPGMPGTGYYTTGTSTSYPKTPAGPNSWKLTALYQGNYADYANPSTASAVVRVLPPHATPWLTKNNGPSSAAIFQAPKEGPEGQLDNVFDVKKLRWLGKIYSPVGFGLQVWAGDDAPLWGDPTQIAQEAVYGNAVDLGVGRRTRCAQYIAKAPFGVMTRCYATAHGIVPGQAGFNDFNTITRPQEGIGDDFILAMVIAKDDRGTTFLVFLRDPALPYARLTQQVSLDTEGPKYVPQVCMSCHGGKYNPTTRRVDGASFLPLDPGLLAFASPAAQALQEENMRKVNEMIQMSDPQSAVAAYIRGLYGGAWIVPGTRAKVDFVPQGWAPQSGFYLSVVKPYCATCHLAAPPSWNFATWDNFKDNAALIRAAVCNAHTMPHAELQYKAFWTKDTGPVYTPGLLAATLGFPSCP